jgi:glycosyltransferase involved in cell wall biosynthesis
MKKLNILIRTSKRPNFFRECVESIFQQSYQNIKLIICIDDEESQEYVEVYRDYIEKKYPDSVIVAMDRTERNPHLFKEWEGVHLYHAPYNMYFNGMHTLCEEGYLMYLDDDDVFTSNNALQLIANAINNKDNALLLWRVQFPDDRIIPSSDNLGKIVKGDISGIGFAYPIEYVEHGSWDDYSYGDFRVITNLSKHLEIATIDKVLTGLQRLDGVGGLGSRDDKKNDKKR